MWNYLVWGESFCYFSKKEFPASKPINISTIAHWKATIRKWYFGQLKEPMSANITDLKASQKRKRERLNWFLIFFTRCIISDMKPKWRTRSHSRLVIEGKLTKQNLKKAKTVNQRIRGWSGGWSGWGEYSVSNSQKKREEKTYWMCGYSCWIV